MDSVIPILSDKNPSARVFQAPWEAYAFALAVQLSEQGVFDWPEWTEALAAEVHDLGEDDQGDQYYHYWIAALEKLLTQHGLITEEALQERMIAWREAYRRTPHGKPVEL
jgi:nitrile hydratase accessory protein